MRFVRKYLSVAIGVAAGAIAGYAYYNWIGCTSGNCPITSQPLNSTLYGAVMGALLVNMFKKNNIEYD
jgi:hypothetical protein